MAKVLWAFYSSFIFSSIWLDIAPESSYLNLILGLLLIASSLNNFLSSVSAYKARAFVSLSPFSKADTYTSRYETSDESFTQPIFTILKSFRSSALSSSTSAVLIIFLAVFSIFFNL